MKGKIIKYIKEIAFFFLILTIFANVLSIYRSSNLNKNLLDMDTIANPINNSSYIPSKNKPVLIYFWATWCPICKTQSPNIQILSRYYNVVTIAVKSGTNKEIKEYLAYNNLTFNTINDIDGSLSEKLQIAVFPTTIIYNSDGELFYSDVGYTTTFGLFIRMFLAGF